MMELFLDDWGSGPMVSMRVELVFSIRDYSKILSESGKGTLFKKSPGCIYFQDDLDWMLENNGTGGGFISFNEEYNKPDLENLVNEDYLLGEKELVLFRPFLCLGFLYCIDYDAFVKSVNEGDSKTVKKILMSNSSFFRETSIFIQGPKADSRFKEKDKIKVPGLSSYDVISNVVQWDMRRKNGNRISYTSVLCKMAMISNYILLKRNINPFLELKDYDA